MSQDVRHATIQFRLQTLPAPIAVVATSLSLFGPSGVWKGLSVIAVVACLRGASAIGRVLIVTCAILILAGEVASTTASSSRHLGRLLSCQGKMGEITRALHCYHSEHDSFPPAYIADSTGRPMHSWRVLLLPYLDKQALYDRYDFNEPWDGPNNRQRAAEIAVEYRCVTADRADYADTTTSYVAVVGPETAWPGAMPMAVDDIADGWDRTILLVEVVDSGIHCMEPRDLTMKEVLTGVTPEQRTRVSSRHERKKGFFIRSEKVVNVALAGGDVRTIPEDLSPELLKAMLTSSGGEATEISDAWNGRRNDIHWPRCCAVAAFVLWVLYRLFRARGKRLEPT